MSGNVQGPVLAFFVTAGGLLFLGVPTGFHRWAVQRNAVAVHEIKTSAKEAHAEALNDALHSERAQHAKAQAELDELKERRANEQLKAKNAEERNKPALETYTARTAAMTPHGPDLLLDESLSLEDLINKVVLDGLGGKVGFTGAQVSRIAGGFGLEVTCTKGFSWSQQTQLMAGLQQIRATLDPSWVTSVTFGVAGTDEHSIPVGALESLDERRLASFMSTYYGTTAARLPDPNVIGRRTHADAAWVIKNSTGMEVVVDYFGPAQGKVTLRKGEEKEIRLEPGRYHISASATSGDVAPFTGQNTYEGGYAYGSEWVIRTTYENDPFGGAFPGRGR